MRGGTPDTPELHAEIADARAGAEPAIDVDRAPPYVDRYGADAPPSLARRVVWWGIPLVLLAAAAASVYWYWLRDQASQPPAQPLAGAQPAPQAAPEPAIRHPIEDAKPETQEPVAAALPPSVDESDQAVADALAALVGRAPLEQFANLSGFVRRLVATIDNLPRSKAPQRMWPSTQTQGAFITTGGRDAVYLSAENYRRYEPALRFMESVDTGKMIALYVRLYPLFQQAYKDLGYADRYFNDRLIEVIDHLLATPEVAEPIRLAKPWVMYEFADPALEARSAGQKTLTRMGTANAARVKAKLREIRRQVTGRTLPQ
ncbi:MAG TPA: DUF3014 domain-containing protein [Burkholderiales bacterium]|nr:DUF3014 domain-containing protein [Burkholderiales bacterium]